MDKLNKIKQTIIDFNLENVVNHCHLLFFNF